MCLLYCVRCYTKRWLFLAMPSLPDRNTVIKQIENETYWKMCIRHYRTDVYCVLLSKCLKWHTWSCVSFEALICMVWSLVTKDRLLLEIWILDNLNSEYYTILLSPKCKYSSIRSTLLAFWCEWESCSDLIMLLISKVQERMKINKALVFRPYPYHQLKTT